MYISRAVLRRRERQCFLADLILTLAASFSNLFVCHALTGGSYQGGPGTIGGGTGESEKARLPHFYRELR